MATKKELKARWSEELNESVSAQLRAGEMPDPFGLTESGLRDLRGLAFRGILRNVALTAVDMTYCSAERGGQFLGCTLNQVDLSNSTLKTNLDGNFAACRFDGANLSSALFRGRFENCSFSKAKLKNTSGESVTFEECRFDHADLFGAHLFSCIFDTCTWQNVAYGNGSFYRSKFKGEHPIEVGNTIMDHTEFV